METGGTSAPAKSTWIDCCAATAAANPQRLWTGAASRSQEAAASKTAPHPRRCHRRGCHPRRARHSRAFPGEAASQLLSSHQAAGQYLRSKCVAWQTSAHSALLTCPRAAPATLHSGAYPQDMGDISPDSYATLTSALTSASLNHVMAT